VFDGSRTIRESAETKAELLAAVTSDSTIFLDCTAVTAADLSFVQLIIGASKSATKMGGRLLLDAAPGNALADALRRGGFAISENPLDWCGELPQ
jgi:anti-anti-sigma regulatory factor